MQFNVFSPLSKVCHVVTWRTHGRHLYKNFGVYRWTYLYLKSVKFLFLFSIFSNDQLMTDNCMLNQINQQISAEANLGIFSYSFSTEISKALILNKYVLGTTTKS